MVDRPVAVQNARRGVSLSTVSAKPPLQQLAVEQKVAPSQSKHQCGASRLLFR